MEYIIEVVNLDVVRKELMQNFKNGNLKQSNLQEGYKKYVDTFIDTIKDDSMKVAKICSKCGFPVDMPREPVILDDNILSMMHYMENECEDCGHQIDGSTIRSVYEFWQKMGNDLYDERKKLIKFIHKYQFLTEKQKEKVCLEMPRFMRGGYKSEGKPKGDGDIDEPYSWSVVYFEVINDTDLSRSMLNNIDDDRLEDDYDV